MVLIFTQNGLEAASSRLAGSPDEAQLTLVVRKAFLMGTEATLQTYSCDRPAALEQLDAFIRIVEETEEELSTWRPSSRLSQINTFQLLAPKPLSSRMCQLLSTLHFWNRKTEGAFDPAVGALIDAWDLRGQGRQPSQAEISRALGNSGLQRFKLRGCSIERSANVKFDAGAFGKGVALSRALAESEAIVPGPWLINLGGQIVVSGLPPGRNSWDVDLAAPGEASGYGGLVRLQKGSIATSGSFLRDRWVGGVRIGHILDPRTGRPAEFVGSVTVWHEDPLAADILSTALFVMGPRQGLLWAEVENVAACYQTLGENGEVRSRASRLFEALSPSIPE
jgi:thiamine biosynthesis lipoprotein